MYVRCQIYCCIIGDYSDMTYMNSHDAYLVEEESDEEGAER